MQLIREIDLVVRDVLEDAPNGIAWCCQPARQRLRFATGAKALRQDADIPMSS